MLAQLEVALQSCSHADLAHLAIVAAATAFEEDAPEDGEALQVAFRRGLTAIVRSSGPSLLVRSGAIPNAPGLHRPPTVAESLVINVIRRLPKISISAFTTDLLDFLNEDLRLTFTFPNFISKISSFYYRSYMNRVMRSSSGPERGRVAEPSPAERWQSFLTSLHLPPDAEERLSSMVEAAVRCERAQINSADVAPVDLKISSLDEAGASARGARASSAHGEGGREPALVIPTKAPALWQTRNRNDFRNPADFILTVYEACLGEPGAANGITRADLKRLDPALHRSLYDWLGNDDNRTSQDWLSLDQRLPTLAEKHTALLQAYGARHGAAGQGMSFPELSKLGGVARARARKNLVRREP